MIQIIKMQHQTIHKQSKWTTTLYKDEQIIKPSIIFMKQGTFNYY